MFGLFESKQDKIDKLLNNGLRSMMSGRFNNAEGCFLKAIEMDVLNAAEAWNNLGCLYFMTESFKKAKDCFQTAMNQRANYYHAIRGMALVERKLGNEPRAVELFRELQRKFDYKPEEDPTLTEADREWFRQQGF